jgi:hypothetical protein
MKKKTNYMLLSIFTAFVIGLTCFGHHYAHRQELETIPDLGPSAAKVSDGACGNQWYSRQLLAMGIVVPETC